MRRFDKLQDHARTEILDLHQERGTVFDLIEKGEAYILNNTRRRFVIDGAGPRREVPELPAAAVREALVNAFVHRDWTRGACVQVDIFYDSVEILSPGWFIEGQSPEAHLEGGDTSSDTRNRLIDDTVFRSGDMEAYGTGIARIKELCDGADVRVEYVRVPSGTKLVFHRNDAFAAESESPVRESAGKVRKRVYRDRAPPCRIRRDARLRVDARRDGRPLAQGEEDPEGSQAPDGGRGAEAPGVGEEHEVRHRRPVISPSSGLPSVSSVIYLWRGFGPGKRNKKASLRLTWNFGRGGWI